MIQERGHTGEGRLALVFDFDGEFDFGFHRAAKIGNALEDGDEADALTAQHGLAKLHLVHAIVHHHLEVVHRDDLLPKVGQEREREIAVHDGLSEGAFFGSLGVYVYPLVVERGVGKHVDALLRHFEPVGCAEHLAQM